MKYYFKLQYLRLQRKIAALGCSPWLGILLGIILFIILSLALFYKTSMASIIYLIIAVLFAINLSETTKTRRLKMIFSNKEFLQIRLCENFLFCLPFALILLYQGEYLLAVALLSFTETLVFIETNFSKIPKLPTPFKKWPFEFVVGFRKTFLLLILLLILCIIGLRVDNFNLSLFCLGAVFLIAMTYYMKPERVYFTWIHTMSAKQFLWKKIKEAFICMTILSLPFLVLLFLNYPQQFIWIVSIQTIGYLFLISMIFAKYSAYPNEMNVPQGILYGLSLWFPPMLLIALPIFYKKSVRQLKQILE